MTTLLRDVIADAKQVKATAMANARQTILETFQPSVQRIVSARIAEEEGDEEEVDIDINLDEPSEGGSDIGFGASEETPAIEEPVEGDEEDMELEALMREFEEEEDMMGESDDEYMEEEYDELEESTEDGGAYTHSAPPESGKNSTGDLNESEIDEILEALYEEDDEELMGESDGYEEDVPSKQLNTESKTREIKQLRRQLGEAMKAITVLKKTINEVNLLNAKLMYSQKIFQKLELSENQKVKVLEAFDRANTVREVKSKYLDIVTLTNKSSQKRKMTEGSASKPGTQISAKKSLKEQYDYAPRWRVLAGLDPAY